MAWLICGNVPQENFTLDEGPWNLDDGMLFPVGRSGAPLPVRRGTPALVASAILTCSALGEGTVEAMAAAAGGKAVVDPVTGPLGWPVQARSLRLPGDVAVMEMAEASGLLLVPEEKRNPLITSTFGTGEMIDRALARGDRHIYMGIGGSATCDGGMGAMEALGVRFLDRNGRKLPGQGSSLGRVETIDLSCLHEGVEDMDLTILSDVTNPLWGERGAARAFGPQKGANPAMVEKLEAGMVHYGRVLEDTFGVDVEHLSGGGALRRSRLPESDRRQGRRR